MCPIDPQHEGFALGNPDAEIRQQLGDLARRVAALESTPTIRTNNGGPTSTPRAGTPAVDTSTNRLYLYVNGAWRYTALT